MANLFDTIQAEPNKTTGKTHETNISLLNETFHVFSKSPAANFTTLGGARNKSGHTTTTADVWAEEVPQFFSALNEGKFNAFKSLAKLNDLCVYAVDGKVYRWEAIDESGTLGWKELFSSFDAIPDGQTFVNGAGVPVVRFHKNRVAQNLTPDNNNGADGDQMTAKIFGWDKTANEGAGAPSTTDYVTQFISPMDKMSSGVPSLGYDTIVKDSTGQLNEGFTDDVNYLTNAYAGLVQFNKKRAQGSITISAFEYIGAKLDATVAKLSAAVFGSGTPDDEETPASLSEQVTANTTALNVLKGNDEVEGSIAHSIKTAIKNLGDVAVKSDITITEIKVKSGSTTTTLTPDSNKSVTVEIPDVQAATTDVAGVVTISDSNAIAIDETSTAAATVAAVAATRSAIAGEMGALAGTVEDAMEEAQSKVASVSGPTSGLVSVTGDKEVTITVSDTIATKSDITTEISNATSKSAIVDNDTSTKLVTASQVATYVASEVGAIDTGVTTISVNGGAAQKGAVSITALEGVETSSHTGISPTSISINNVGNKVKLTAISAGAQVSENKLSYKQDYLATAADADTIATFRAEEAKDTLDGRSLASLASSTQGSYVTVTTGGTVGSGLTVNVNDSALASTVSAASTAIQTVKVNGTALTATDNAVDIKIPHLKVSNAKTTTGDPFGFEVIEWSDGTTFSSHYITIAAAEYDANTKTWGAGTTGYFTTASTVESFVNATVGADLTALENKVNAYHKAGVSYKIHTEPTLPDLSIEDNVKEYKNVILLVSKIPSPPNTPQPPSALSGDYTEFLCVNKGTEEAPEWVWEQIGTTAADLSGYVRTIAVNGKSLSNTNDGGNNPSYLELGSFAETVASGQATTLANQGSVYANIATNGTLTLGVASATDSVMGVSKMFTGDLSTAASTATDTAVSVKSAQAMYSTLATQINSKVSDVVTDTYLSLAGFSVAEYNSHVKTITTDVLNSSDSLQSVVQYCVPVAVEGGILTSNNGYKRPIATDKIVDGTNMFATSTIETWVDDLSSMTNGTAMFKNCSKLTTFIGDLSSLETADEMFYGCTLDAESLEILADTLPTVTSGTIDFGASTNATAEVIATIKGKGWILKSNGAAL